VRLVLGLLTGLLALAAVAFYLDSRRDPAALRSRDALPSCGSATARPGGELEGLPPAVVACFDAAIGGAAGAELRLVSRTVEGDEIVSYYRALPRAGVEVLVDSTADDYGTRGWSRRECPRATALAALGTCSSTAL
jgi:hypothetical protein